MSRTIELSDESERVRDALVRLLGADTEDTVLQTLADEVLSRLRIDARPFEGGIPLRLNDRTIYVSLQSATGGPVRATNGVMGGDACIRGTRIPVWLVVAYKKSGYGDERILSNFPGLTAADLIAAWDYYAAHADSVEAERRAHEDAD